MFTILFVVVGFMLVIWTIGNSLAVKALVRYIVKKGYEPPSSKGLRVCIQEELKSKFPWYSGKA